MICSSSRRAIEHAAQQRLDELGVDLVEVLVRARLLHRIAAGKLPGVERLQRDLARLALSGFHACSLRSLAISTATRTASAPLSSRAFACASSSVVRMPLATGRPDSSATSITPRADSLHTTSKW